MYDNYQRKEFKPPGPLKGELPLPNPPEGEGTLDLACEIIG